MCFVMPGHTDRVDQSGGDGQNNRAGPTMLARLFVAG
jgi:hypothetical protein